MVVPVETAVLDLNVVLELLLPLEEEWRTAKRAQTPGTPLKATHCQLLTEGAEWPLRSGRMQGGDVAHC